MAATNAQPLVFWKDLSPSPVCLEPATPYSPRALIVGGGVIGLITAWALLDKGYHVTIVASEWASYGKEQRLTSQIAGALWEYPPAVCGQHTDAISLQHSRKWCMVSYHIWDAIAAKPDLAREAGVSVRPADFFFPFHVEEDATQLAKMKEIAASGVRGFRHTPSIVQERDVNPEYGAVDAYEMLAPVIDTDRAMTWLMDLVQRKGARLVTRTIHGDLLHQEQALRAEYAADVIINATGIAGTELAGDASCYPIRGGLIRVINDGSDFPVIDAALSISADVANEIVFLVPRNDKILIIGGITEPHESALDYTLDTPIIKRMRARAEAFLPQLKNARVDPDYPIAQGLRPFRKQNVRVERELRPVAGESILKHSRIIHTYGHGGAGWSLAFGCAADVLAMVEEALQDKAPSPLATDADRARKHAQVGELFSARL
ncbi:FAD dependent oxidoreductase [Dichomitus squalens]|uniref:FAD dependent oxidoreductase n=1 Tax=Dichomitus squalens TaxID=114155 RepID=A0A4Q9MRS9_9APHY|nr:FAD dependent oxidoreductase [Dichomitus squalens]TBU40661.1 FAD dependent oxidoreductase [Dichomitus squalens]TBU53475.1 FAD dependent oxidoreductase [Dichomitus squalens]